MPISNISNKNNLLPILARSNNNYRSIVDIVALSNSVIIIDNILRSSTALYKVNKVIIDILFIYLNNKIKDIDIIDNLDISNIPKDK